MSTRTDDRTDEQRTTHPILVIGTDTFMSGWGGARDGMSYAAWACEPKDERRVFDWVDSRSDMKRVRVTCDPYKPNCAHLHIYVVDYGHPALGSLSYQEAL